MRRPGVTAPGSALRCYAPAWELGAGDGRVDGGDVSAFRVAWGGGDGWPRLRLASACLVLSCRVLSCLAWPCRALSLATRICPGEICASIIDGDGGEGCIWRRGEANTVHTWSSDGRIVHHRVSQYCHRHTETPYSVLRNSVLRSCHALRHHVVCCRTSYSRRARTAGASTADQQQQQQ